MLNMCKFLFLCSISVILFSKKTIWIYKKNTYEWILFNEKDVEKVFKDAGNGWAIKYRNDNVEHLDEDTYETSLKPTLAATASVDKS